MSQENFCQDCHQKDECQEAYRRLGSSECPPVFYKTVVAFLMPMVVFIVFLAVFEKILSGGNYSQLSHRTQTAIGFLMALVVTVVFMIVFMLLSKLFRKFFRISKISSTMALGQNTFCGGVHPPGKKSLTSECAIQYGYKADQIAVMLSQHIGAMCKPVVAKGDEVKAGQKVGDIDSFVSAPVHSPVDGKVKEIALRSHPVIGDKDLN